MYTLSGKGEGSGPSRPECGAEALAGSVCSEVQQKPEPIKLKLASRHLELLPLCSSGALPSTSPPQLLSASMCASTLFHFFGASLSD